MARRQDKETMMARHDERARLRFSSQVEQTLRSVDERYRWFAY
jgi:hypothetical protein